MMGWRAARKWAVACFPGDWSQHPTWAQIWHTRKCTQSRFPMARQSSQPDEFGSGSAIVSRCEQPLSAITRTLPSARLLRVGQRRLRSPLMAGDGVTIEAAGRELVISHPEKVFFDERGDTKLDLVRFYQSVEAPLLAAMGGRPVLMQRFPNGASGSSFFQKRVPDSRPDWLETTIVSTPNGTTSRALIAADLAHVLWAVNMGCLGFHVWPSTADDPEHADELRIDLDPTAGVTFPMVQEAAHEVRALLDEVGVAGLPKTTGNRGIHVYARLLPRWTSYDDRAAAVAIDRELQRRRPDLITAA